MEKNKLVTAIAIIGSICSITGLSLLGIVGNLPEKSPIPTIALIMIGVVLLISLAAVWFLRSHLIRANKLRDGRIVSTNNRSETSRAFAKGTLRTLRVFAGDLSWLEQDLAAYRALTDRGVTIQILTDTPNALAIEIAKPLGIQFRQYPGAIEAPLKVSISDGEEESESRALVVKRRTFRPGTTQSSEYCYWMKEYHGSFEYAAIKAMMLLFDMYFTDGTPV